MAGGMFEKAFAAWDALFGTDELRAALEDEQAENTWLLDEIGGLKAEIHTLRSLLESARQETRDVQKQLDEARNHEPQAYVGKEQGSNATNNRLMGEGTSLAQAIAELDETIRRDTEA